MWEFTDRNRVGLINNYFLLAFLFNLVPYHHCLPLFFHPIIGNYPHTHTSSLSANYSFSHSLFLLSVPLPFVLFFFSFSLPHWLSFTRCPLPRTDQSILQQSVRAFLRGGREDCSGWAFLLFLRWQRHRGAIDSSTELHSLLMLECLILWRFSQTEIDRAELCTVHLNLQLFKIFFFLQTSSEWASVVSMSLWKDMMRKLHETDTQTSWPPWRCSWVICLDAEDSFDPAAVLYDLQLHGHGSWVDLTAITAALSEIRKFLLLVISVSLLKVNVRPSAGEKFWRLPQHAEVFSSGLNQTSELI